MDVITGRSSSRRVFLGTKENESEREIVAGPSQRLKNHSPDGFMWGYAGSGPAQLALAILLEFMDGQRALENYQQFKFDVIASLDKDKDFVLPIEKVRDWIEAHTEIRYSKHD